MRRAVLLAHPAGHSLSPPMQDAAFAAAGIDARYEAWDVPPEGLHDALRRLREGAFLGANVTVPHKRAVMEGLDAVSPEARAIGAVNTLRADGGRLVGENTDAVGFEASLREAGLDATGRTAVLLGAGGAARAVAHALLRVGVAELRVVNRTPAAADALVRALSGAADGRARAFAAGDGAAHAGADLWVNATSVGMVRDGRVPDASPVPADAFAGGAGAAVDLVYRPRRTRFLRDAAAAGLRTLDGVGMLVHQGAASFRAWTGAEPPVAAMRAAVEAALDAEAAA